MPISEGKHVIIDFYSCYQEPISSPESIHEWFSAALASIQQSDTNHIQFAIYPEEFYFTLADPHMHIALHVYPKYSYVALDLFYFKKHINTGALIKAIKGATGAERIKTTTVKRGDFGKDMDMKPRYKTKITAKARVKRTGKQLKNTGTKMLHIITRSKKKNEKQDIE